MSREPGEPGQRVAGMESDVERTPGGAEGWPNAAHAVQSVEQGGEGAANDSAANDSAGDDPAVHDRSGDDMRPVAEDDPAFRQAIADDATASRFTTVDAEDAGELAVPFHEPDEARDDARGRD